MKKEIIENLLRIKNNKKLLEKKRRIRSKRRQFKKNLVKKKLIFNGIVNVNVNRIGGNLTKKSSAKILGKNSTGSNKNDKKNNFAFGSENNNNSTFKTFNKKEFKKNSNSINSVNLNKSNIEYITRHINSNNHNSN